MTIQVTKRDGSKEALDIAIGEIGQSSIPGLYLLFDERSGKKVYIGQSENIKNRLAGHIKAPEDKIKNWERAYIINDARNASTSDLSDENIRLILENFLVKLFKINRYKVVTESSRTPSSGPTQNTLAEAFKEEIVILLTRRSKIRKVITEKVDDEVHNEEARKKLIIKGHKIEKWGQFEAIVNFKKLTF